MDAGNVEASKEEMKSPCHLACAKILVCNTAINPSFHSGENCSSHILLLRTRTICTYSI